VTSSEDAMADWLSVIGKSLTRMCLQQAQRTDPDMLDTVLKRVAFLEGLGLTRDDAAEAAGTSAASVRELHRQTRVRKAKNGNAKKKRSG
jgi:hypothetical protein